MVLSSVSHDGVSRVLFLLLTLSLECIDLGKALDFALKGTCSARSAR